jgi:hypothetical protein
MQYDFTSSARRRLHGAILAMLSAGAIASILFCFQRDASAQVVVVAPPAPRVEVVAVAPTPASFWVPGYWGYVGEGAGYAWHEGRWEGARPGYGWWHARWRHEGRRWHFAPGHWYHRR